MQGILQHLTHVEDRRQQSKVRHLMSDIIGIVFFATLANADEWTQIHAFAEEYEDYLRKYFSLPNGIPSHDTIQRVFAMVSPEFLQGFQKRWNDMLLTNEGEKLKKLLSIDGKSQRGNGTATQKANHIVSAIDENGFCLGQKKTDDKSNEITAIPDLLGDLNIKGNIITTDAIGCQTEIVKIIRKKHADYCLALKGNQRTLHGDVERYFADKALRKSCQYTKTTQKARSCIEKREYWQTDDIAWLHQKKDWVGLTSIAMTRNTITQISTGEVSTETRYFISSLSLDVREIARAIRGHWMVESYHWHLDVTFREDANQTAEKIAAFNLNIIRKISINILKLLDMGDKKVSLKQKRFRICLNVERYIERVLAL